MSSARLVEREGTDESVGWIGDGLDSTGAHLSKVGSSWSLSSQGVNGAGVRSMKGSAGSVNQIKTVLPLPARILVKCLNLAYSHREIQRIGARLGFYAISGRSSYDVDAAIPDPKPNSRQTPTTMEQNQNLKGTDTPNAGFSSQSVGGAKNQDFLGARGSGSRICAECYQNARSTNSSRT